MLCAIAQQLPRADSKPAVINNALRMVNLRLTAPKGLQVENTENQDLHTVEPGMRTPSQAAVEEKQFQHVGQQQEAASQFDQHLEGNRQDNGLIDQHHHPETQRQDFPQPPKQLHDTPLLFFYFCAAKKALRTVRRRT
jgi:hypothetical protein